MTRATAARDGAVERAGNARDAAVERAGVVRDATVEMAGNARVAAVEKAAAVKDSATESIKAIKPKFRGVSHEWAFFLSLGLGISLLMLADTQKKSLAVGIYAVSLCALFGTSALYHRINWKTVKSRMLMRRLDHSMIFLLIAGTYTPLCLLALSPAWGIPLLIVVWAAAIGGVITKMARLGNGPGNAGSWLYIVIGWAAVAAVPGLVTSLDALQLVLLAIGGLLYTVGAVVLARRWPDPFPDVFGYHEVWHAMTVAAGACHFAVVALVLH